MTDDPETSYALALDEARRAFDALANEVTIVRDRAVSMLGMGGLAAAFLSGLAFRDGAPMTGWTWVAVASFALLALLSIVMLWPKRFHVAQDPATLVGWLDSGDYRPRQADRELALWLGKKYEDNRPGVDRLGLLLFAASIALLLEIAALILDLITR